MKQYKFLQLDMDGVFADFYTLLEHWFKVDHWKEIESRELILNTLKGTDFFYKIPLFPNSLDLLRMIDEKTKGQWNILSTPLEGDFTNSVYHKNRWLNDVFKKAKVKPLDKLFTKDKWKYATTNNRPNLLVDDRPQNLKLFIEKGQGLGIRYQNNESSYKKFIKKIDALSWHLNCMNYLKSIKILTLAEKGD